MPRTRIDIDDRRIKIDVIVANTSNTSMNNTYSALIDTGPVESLISEKIVNDLKLSKSGDFVTIVDMNGNEIKSDRYKCYILFNGHTKTFDMNIGLINRKGLDIIIGMDILELSEIDIKNGIFTISS